MGADKAYRNKHSAFSSTFPIYLFKQENQEVPDEEAEGAADAEVEKESKDEFDDDMIVEDDETPDAEAPAPKTKTVVVDKWEHLNSQAPIWSRYAFATVVSFTTYHTYINVDRDPKTISDEEYQEFYKATFKDFIDPLAWSHFSGVSESGVAFKAIAFIPTKL